MINILACIYYDEKKEFIIDVSPQSISPEIRSHLEETWAQTVPRKVLIALSDGEKRLPDIQKKIGHSASTIHEAVKRLSELNFISTEMIYKGNKQKIITSNILCVTKNPKSKSSIQRFFQGLWIDSKKTKKLVDKLRSEKKKWWTEEELSAQTKIPVDEIRILLSNFDSPTTKGFSQFLKDVPFEKKVLYKGK